MLKRTPNKRERDPDAERFLKALGARIRELRTARGHNQDDFADLVGIHRTHVGMLENAKLDAKASTLYRLARALGITVAELTDVSTDERNQP